MEEFVASQVQVSSIHREICDETNAPTRERAGDGNEVPSIRRACAPEERKASVTAHSVEFVALPGRAEGVQLEITAAMRHAFGAADGFMGCMVLVSEQESRLVTVITLWGGSRRSEWCNESEKRLQKWLAPYVDRWLRTRKHVSFVAPPARLVTDTRKHEGAPESRSLSHLQ